MSEYKTNPLRPMILFFTILLFFPFKIDEYVIARRSDIKTTKSHKVKCCVEHRHRARSMTLLDVLYDGQETNANTCRKYSQQIEAPEG